MSAIPLPSILTSAPRLTISIEILCSGCYDGVALRAESITGLTRQVEVLQAEGWDLRGPLFLCPTCRLERPWLEFHHAAGVVRAPWYMRLWRSVRRALGVGE